MKVGCQFHSNYHIPDVVTVLQVASQIKQINTSHGTFFKGLRVHYSEGYNCKQANMAQEQQLSVHILIHKQELEHIGTGMKPQNPSPVTHFLQQGHTFS